jgi:Trk K+ transport system NAD-binding subunit
MTQDPFPDTLARTAGPPALLVVSDSYLGPTLLSEIQPRDGMRLVTHDAGIAARAPTDVDVTVGDVTAVDTLERAADVDAAVVSLRTDRETLLVTQLLRTRFDIGDVLVVLNDPEHRDTLSDVATVVVSGPETLSTELRRTISTAAEPHDR